MQRSASDGLDVEAGKVRVADFLRSCLDAKRPNLRPESYRRYRDSVERHIIPHVGRMPLESLTPLAI